MSSVSAWAMERAVACWGSFAEYPTYINTDKAADRIATALDAAREQGRREGLEEAARVCDARADSFNDPTHCQMCAICIRALGGSPK